MCGTIGPAKWEGLSDRRVLAGFGPSVLRCSHTLLMVHVLNKISPFLPFMLTDAFLDVFIQYWPFRRGAISFAEVVSSGPGSSWSLCRPVGMWCDAALSRIGRRIFSSLWQSVGSERLLRAASTSSLYLSQLAFFRST